MAKSIKLTAEDGHELDAYVAEPEGRAAGAVVVVQEIFGVNAHIRTVCDDYAQEGFMAIAPALFDRVERGVELGYGPESGQRGMGMAKKIGIEVALKDVAAALYYAQSVVGNKGTGVVGFCLGGSLAWLAATRLNPAAAVGYYGGRIAQYAQEEPRCPVMLHFGAKDAHIGAEKIDQIQRAHPKIPIFMYDAGHGFNCDQRGSYDEKSARLARERTLGFLRENLRA